MKYKHLDKQSEYYPFAVRAQLRRRRARRAALLLAAGLLLLAAAGALWLRQTVASGQPRLTEDELWPEAVVAEGEGAVSRTEQPGGTVLARYQRLYQQNPDLIGWLEIEDTAINYPVMQTPGDNEKYLRLGFDGAYAPGGCLFLDERCSVRKPTANWLIYGHNMGDDTMFSALLQYADPAFAALHPTIRFDSLYQTGAFEVVAALYATVEEQAQYPYYAFFDAQSEEEWQRYYQNIQQVALYDTGVTAQYGDQLLTLSTCAVATPTNRRFAVVARRVEE